MLRVPPCSVAGLARPLLAVVRAVGEAIGCAPPILPAPVATGPDVCLLAVILGRRQGEGCADIAGPSLIHRGICRWEAITHRLVLCAGGRGPACRVCATGFGRYRLSLGRSGLGPPLQRHPRLVVRDIPDGTFPGHCLHDALGRNSAVDCRFVGCFSARR